MSIEDRIAKIFEEEDNGYGLKSSYIAERLGLRVQRITPFLENSPRFKRASTNYFVVIEEGSSRRSNTHTDIKERYNHVC
ncbi:hypothetical protein AKJ37_06455 [candidate division MSBL1 archaeon SCGC-AAA259I09]|uniref:Uncharacterized protein n=10 Tax=candidate division MSBL1 TaxID=215777 RepID=A0A133UYV3_9EURY|nr:hypothetical protein AKJ62_04450 [candidate division MSBL1 archaeon SCGC-AAA259D14]KXA88878.1 hypothetical protein AKJ61_03995 [candidate division MSBL1 archaeon SCGC-AAA259B11]KXA89123.1 hypothetical protein AKJ57_05810 [candidate division MSBL1 archaeon SCGC-AAA259A05]KXA91939.1 hypothetical protein AKJ64_04325 [candidate division MSBL1 archaeon SCGC-AAA259E17]KXA92740.1 hypothetical protein AKJ65_07120 [candidate division MSBL1 archaeon SCGC-AAA259E19]KXA94255.1 hypothetical protein AKJ3